ncbi:MAG: DUF616 domain-containing protein [bacterium]|nr:MAG: DUF616 domain-containing protein [bacterium]
MDSKRIVIYTAIFGGYDGLLPQLRLEGTDYVCFTDRAMKSKTWQVRVIDPVYTDPVRNARLVKVLPHRYLPEYDISIWIDGNIMVVGDVRRLIDHRMNNTQMLAYDHDKTPVDRRNCIYDELQAILDLGAATESYKDDPEVMKAQIERYRAEGYPPQNGLISTGVLIRRHNDETVRRVMESWWAEIEGGSKRDQLSFNYVTWRERFDVGLLDGDIRDNRYFYMIGMHRCSYRGKLFRYRLRRFFGLIRHSD